MIKKKLKKGLSAADEAFYRSFAHVIAILFMLTALTAVFAGMVVVFAPAFEAASDVTGIIVISCAQITILCGMKIVVQWTYWAGANIGLRLVGIPDSLPMPGFEHGSPGPIERILCISNRHDYQVANDHPEGNMGYLIYECTRCHKAMVSDPGVGFFPIINTADALAKKAKKAALRECGK